MARRLGRTVPFVGAGIALIAVAPEIRRKGLLGGVLNTALDAIPFVGAAKNLIEMVRGDFIPDRSRGETSPEPGEVEPAPGLRRKRASGGR